MICDSSKRAIRLISLLPQNFPTQKKKHGKVKALALFFCMESFVCPLTGRMMEDPVVADDGISYERQAIVAWFEAGNRVSPSTAQPISTDLIANNALKTVIAEWKRGQQKSESELALEEVSRIRESLVVRLASSSETLQRKKESLQVLRAETRVAQNELIYLQSKLQFAVPQKDKTVDLLVSSGEVSLRQGEFARAIELFSKALMSSPTRADVLALKGIALLKSGSYSEAVSFFSQSLAIDSSSAEVLNNKGVALCKLGLFHESLECFDQALGKCQCRISEIFNNKGVVLRNLGLFYEALDMFQKALQQDPENAAYLKNQADALRDVGQFGHALASYEKSLIQRPGHEETEQCREAVLKSMKKGK
jgi:tetratricopeptide (TPR) repeat protein